MTSVEKEWDNEISLLSVLQSTMNMYSRGETKEVIFDILLEHLLNVTSSDNGMISNRLDKDGKKFHHIIAFKTKNELSKSMENYVRDQGGYIITMHDEYEKQSLLDKVHKTNQLYLIDNDSSRTVNKMIPNGHFKVHNFMGIPLKHNNVVYGMISLANRFNDYSSEIYKKVEPIVEVCNMMLHSYHLDALESIYKKIVQSMSIPIIVYKSPVSFQPGRTPTDMFKNFKCIIVNKSFCKRASSTDTEILFKIQDHTLLESFPNLPGYPELFGTLVDIFESKTSNYIECIEYEDYLIPKSQYEIRLCYVDDKTFIMSIDDISDKIRAKQVADNIIRSKEEFIANISHEMRTPLNGIIGYTALIMDTPLNDYQKECFSTIRECSMNLLYRVNDLLDLSKLTAGKMELMEEDFSLPDCISASYDVNSLDAKQKNIDVSYFIEPDVPTIIRSDSHKLQQILVNLLNNAIKFTDHGKINTQVRLINDPITESKLDARKRYTIEFTVSDTGIGISSHDIEKLFLPFNQLHQSDRINHGTGLGLVITKKLCELMGGNIRAESSIGKGSKFIFYIKVEGNDVNDITDEQESLLFAEKKVLVVDDNEVNRVMICNFLGDWGCKPIICSSAKEALFYLEKKIIDFDLGLLDIRMPNKDGNELAEEIYQIDPALPLIALSSIPLPSHKISPRFKYYLTKPIKRKKLKEVCVNLFSTYDSQVTDDSHSHSHSHSHSQALSSVSVNNSSIPHSLRSINNRTSSLSVKQLDHCYSPSSYNKFFKIPSQNKVKKHSRAKLILAEDMYMNQKVTIQILHKLGYKNVDLAENGRQLLDKIMNSTSDYDLIFMDLKMPVMDGFEAALEIQKLYKSKAFGNRKKPKIIALTARVMSGVKEKCIKYGMDDYITKPMEIDSLDKKISNLLNES